MKVETRSKKTKPLGELSPGDGFMAEGKVFIKANNFEDSNHVLAVHVVSGALENFTPILMVMPLPNATVLPDGE